MFQKKKQSGAGTKKKKKKDRSSSGSARSPSPGERRRRSSSQERSTKPHPELVTQEEKAPAKEVEDVEVDEISQADTDRDAPSIASEVGSPIPFEVSRLSRCL